MSHLTPLTLRHTACASRPVVAARVNDTVSGFYFGYWFSHWRA
jgi:hypothetical protein